MRTNLLALALTVFTAAPGGANETSAKTAPDPGTAVSKPPAGRDEADKAWVDAISFAKSGEFAKSLERYEWFYNNVQRIKGRDTPVRNTSALMLWKELGNKYPPALASLKATRDTGAKSLMAGTAKASTFSDVVAINGYLNEVPETLKLFKALDAKNPALAKECFGLLGVEKIILESGDAEMIARYTGDPLVSLKKKIEDHDRVCGFLKEGKRGGWERNVKEMDDLLVTETLQLVDVATKRKDAATAAKLKQMAAKSVADPRLAN